VPSLGSVVDPFGLWSRASLAVLDRVLASKWAEGALDMTLRSALAERAVRTVVEGPLADAAVLSAIRARLVERIAADLLESGAVARLLDSDDAQALAGEVLDSRLVDTSVARVLASEELWLVVDEVARSPSVTEAIAHQGAGFADQVADDLGERSRRADARLERVARRLLRRRPAAEDADGAVAMPDPP
jgi:hypothetical protein